MWGPAVASAQVTDCRCANRAARPPHSDSLGSCIGRWSVGHVTPPRQHRRDFYTGFPPVEFIGSHAGVCPVFPIFASTELSTEPHAGLVVIQAVALRDTDVQCQSYRDPLYWLVPFLMVFLIQGAQSNGKYFGDSSFAIMNVLQKTKYSTLP